MTAHRSNSWTKPAIRVAAAGLGAAVAGPLGGALGSCFGAALGGSAAALLETYADKFGDKAAEKLLEIGSDSLVGRLKDLAPSLESVYRETLRLSLAEIHRHLGVEFNDWFANWESCLASTVPLDLPSVQPDQLVPTKLDGLVTITLERLDAQGAAMREKNLSLELKCRVLPESLLSELNSRLPERLAEHFRTLIVKPEYEQPWKRVGLTFQDFTNAALRRIDETAQKIDRKTDSLAQIAEDVTATRKMVEGFFNSAEREGRVPDEQLKARDAEIERLTEQLRDLREQLASRASESGEATLSKLLAKGDLGGALSLKTQQVDARRRNAEKLPRDLFELGMLYELRFDWPNALASFHK